MACCILVIAKTYSALNPLGMYITRLSLKNIGPIAEAIIEPRFLDDGNPVPIVIVGQNGTGKSLTLSVGIDAMTEIRRVVFNELSEVSENKYLKLMSRRYIRQNQPYSLAELSIANNGNVTTYREVLSASDAAFMHTNYPEIAALASTDPSFQESGASKKANVPQHLYKDFRTANFLYFPFFRYERAAWLSGEAKVDFAKDDKFTGYAPINPIRTSIIDETRKWILNLILDRELYEKVLLRLPVSIAGSPIYSQSTMATVFSGYNGPNSALIEMIQTVLTSMFNAKDKTITSSRLDVAQKGNRTISVYIQRGLEPEELVAPDLDMLSSGELMTIAIATEIIRADELVKGFPPQNLVDVTGIVLIDEVDLHLHISFQRDVLPSVIRQFPKVQFVMTTHSPLFVLGMKASGPLDIISMPNGIKISAEDFSEFEEGYKILVQKNDQFKLRFQELKEKIVDDNKPLIVTEGKTDWQHLKNALIYWQSQGKFTNLDIAFFEFDDSTDMGDSKLKQMCESFSLINKDRKTIFVFDRDNKNIIRDMSGNPEPYRILNHNVFSLCIPTPNHRKDYENLSIELYYTDADVSTREPNTNKRLWFSNEIKIISEPGGGNSIFEAQSSANTDKELTKKVYDENVEKIKDSSGQFVGLSKAAFAANIAGNLNLSSNFDRTAFINLFDLIEQIVALPTI